MTKNKPIWKIHDEILENKYSLKQMFEEQKEKTNYLINNNFNAILNDLFPSDELINEIDKNFNLNKENLLYGMNASIKDNICTKNIITTGGSKFLKKYKPCFDATIIKMLKNKNVIIGSKNNLDEFGLGGTGTWSAFGIVKNFFNDKKIAGGSSSGAAVMVASGACNFAIATDTGDSIRKPASYHGIVGFKPSYGIISRFGVMPYSPSLDHVGILANDTKDVSLILSAINQKDWLDNTSIGENLDYYSNLSKKKKIKIAVLNDVLSGLNKSYINDFKGFYKFLEKKYDLDYVEFGLDLLQIIEPIYMAISYTEAVSSWNNLSGNLFGNNIDYINFNQRALELRTNDLGDQIKRRFVIGNNFSNHENFKHIFMKSKKIRTLIINRANEILNKYDCVIIPGASDVAFYINDVINGIAKTNFCDDALQIANFAGLPSITIPFIQKNDDHIGLNIFGQYLDDQNILNIAYTLEDDIKEYLC